MHISQSLFSFRKMKLNFLFGLLIQTVQLIDCVTYLRPKNDRGKRKLFSMSNELKQLLIFRSRYVHKMSYFTEVHHPNFHPL